MGEASVLGGAEGDDSHGMRIEYWLEDSRWSMFENAKEVGEFLNLALSAVGFALSVITCFCVSIHIWLFKLTSKEAVKAGIALFGGIAWAIAIVWVFVSAPELILRFGLYGFSIPTAFVSLYVDLMTKNQGSIESRLRARHRRGTDADSG